VRRRAQAGLTLIEVLIASALLIVVVSATLTAFDVFGARVGESSIRVDAQDTVRTVSARVVRDLRAASVGGTAGPILRAGAGDVVFSAADTGGGTRLARFCADAAGRRLWFQRAPLGGASLPAPACPDAGWGESSVLIEGLAGASPFAYDSASAGDVRTVRLTLTVDADPSRPPGPTSRVSAAALRNPPAQTAVVPSFTATCSGGKVLLTASIAAAAGRRITADYSQDGVSIGFADSLLQRLGPGTHALVLTVTDELGRRTTASRTVTCP
jgi:hypothetical protein